MKYSRTKKQKFGVFAIVYSLVIMLAVLQFGGIIFNASIFAVDEWSTTVKPATGIRIEESGKKTTMYVSTPTAFDYALYYASNPISTVDLTIELVNSIDMSAKYIKPKIIADTKLTKLTIKGNGHIIEGLKYNAGVSDTISLYTGLIGVMCRPLLVENLSLRVLSTNNISSVNCFGALMGATNHYDITVKNCSVYGIIKSSNISHWIGGLIGFVNGIGINSITNCWSYCTMDISNKGAGIGGLIGYEDGSINTFSNCAKFEGDITSNINSTIGGLVGYSCGIASFDKCLNLAKVESKGGCVGGLVGCIKNEGVSVNDCYNNANLSCGSGTQIGGLVGQSESGLKFNRCYSNGELKRSEYGSPSLNKDTSFGDQSIYDGQYVEVIQVMNSPFNIQNNSGDGSGNNSSNGGNGNPNTSPPAPPTPPTHEPPCPYHYEEIIHEYNFYVYAKYDCGALNSLSSNLCGNVATYYNSYCRNTYSVSSDFKIMELYFRFTYENTSHNIGWLSIYKSGQHYFTNANSYPSNYNTGAKTYNFAYLQSYKCINGGDSYISGIRVEPTGNQFKLQATYASSGLSESDRAVYDYLLVNLPSITTTSNGSLVDDINTIKNANLGDEYIVKSDMNDGLPILKDFYW